MYVSLCAGVDTGFRVGSDAKDFYAQNFLALYPKLANRRHARGLDGAYFILLFFNQ